MKVLTNQEFNAVELLIQECSEEHGGIDNHEDCKICYAIDRLKLINTKFSLFYIHAFIWLTTGFVLFAVINAILEAK
jgi:hypothetical protein